MGKPTGFLEYPRVVSISREPLERIRDWKELHGHLPEETLKEQGARCMDCGVPFCHTGRMLAGQTTGCPLNNLIPEWNDQVSRGNWRRALDLLHETNNFPEFTGRVCPAPCEGACVLGINDAPVTIKSIEAAIINRGWEEGWIAPSPPAVRTGKKVAVIGSGPAGLAAAAELNRAGHQVTVFERADRIGGLLTYGIPQMKLENAVVQRRVQLLADEGVVFVTGTEVGRSYPTEKLRSEFDAVVLCGGSTVPRDLDIEGRDLEGIHFAMDFLSATEKSLLDSHLEDGNFISTSGRNVVVIGGGDTGTDCVSTSMRHGCESLVQLEILSRPPDERASDNPWPEWPKVYRLDYGQEEAAAVFGSDPRQYTVSTRRFIGEAGRVRAVEVVEVRQVEGRFEEVPGSEREIPADLVFLAMGFLGPQREGLISELGVALDARGNVTVDEQQMTSVPGVFSAGDMSRGQSLVVWAIAEGRKAARGADGFLMGR
ncbi:MAG: glutamate synthase subunit beta [Gemmatimonadota bacterium]|jgi:glutamate synthase (NADPH/NADH) small chain|nr:glutamate synthase subunit beta [Gemmatimonadota bacterium]